MSGWKFRNPLKFFVAAMLLLFLCGCGYSQPGKKSPLRLEQPYRKLAITEVNNPTLETWIEPRLRSLFRDEMTERGQTEWVRRKDATAFVKLDVVRFGSSSLVKGAEDQTLKYQVRIIIVARITSAESGSLLWSSGKVEVEQSYFKGNRRKAEELAVELAVREIADRLTQAY